MWIGRIPFLLFCAAAARILFDWASDPDLWWHLFFGKFALQGNLERIDRFSFTASGSPFINHEWLSEAFFAGAFQTFGEVGLIALKTCIALLIIYIAWWSIRPERSLLRGIFGALILTVLTPGISFRPQIFSYLLMAAIPIVAKSRIGFSPLTYLIIFAIWANLHGAWPFGLLILAVQFRTLSSRSILCVLLAILGTLINPYGFGLWEYIYRELTNPVAQQFISEWRSFSFKPREMPFGILVCFAVFAAVSERRNFQNCLPSLAGAILGFMSIRHSPILAITLLSICSCPLTLADKFKFTNTRVPESLLFVASLLILFQIPFSRGMTSGEERYPTQQTVEAIKSSCPTIWNPLHFGGFLVYHTAPQTAVSIDGRFSTLYPHEVIAAHQEFDSSTDTDRKIQLAGTANCAIFEKPYPEADAFLKTGDWILLTEDAASIALKKKESLSPLSNPRVP